MKKTVYMVLYLMAVTLAVFYGPKIIRSFITSRAETPITLAADAKMDQNAYFALREVASVQLGYVLVSYEVDEESGLRKAVFSNVACANLQADFQQLKANQKDQQDALHQQVLELGPMADEDESGDVSEEEGRQFRDRFFEQHARQSAKPGGEKD